MGYEVELLILFLIRALLAGMQNALINVAVIGIFFYFLSYECLSLKVIQ